MKTITIRGGSKKNNAVAVLTELLEGRGHKVSRTEEGDVTVCWGRSYAGTTPSLNNNVNTYNKCEAFDWFNKYGVPCPQTFKVEDLGDYILRLPPFPWLARNTTHKQGKDIVKVESFRDAMIAARAQKDFFSVFIPTKTEYRVWVFQNEAFAVYEKQYTGEGEYTGIQRNHRFGFHFEKADTERMNKALTAPAIIAVKALNLDFGAADVLFGKDGKYYVLEVNTMPEIESVKKSSGIRLAKRISEWSEAQ